MQSNKRVSPSKVVQIGLLVMVVILVFALLFSYSLNVIAGRGGVYKVSIDDQTILNLDVTPFHGRKSLVPNNRVANEDETEVIETDVTVYLTGAKPRVGQYYEVELGIENMLIGGDASYVNLINYVYEIEGEQITGETATLLLGRDTVNVKIKVSLEESENKAVYDEIAGKELTFGLYLNTR